MRGARELLWAAQSAESARTGSQRRDRKATLGRSTLANQNTLGGEPAGLGGNPNVTIVFFALS